MLRRTLLNSLPPRPTVCQFPTTPYLSAPHLQFYRSISSTSSALPNLPLFRALKKHDPQSTAVVHSVSGRAFTYGSLLSDVLRAREGLAKFTDGTQNVVKGRPVAFLAENGYDYVVTLLSILSSDGIALPLSPAFPVGELRYILDNSQTTILLATEKYAEKARSVIEEGVAQRPALNILPKIEVGVKESVRDDEVVRFENVMDLQGGMMLYTSGTTNRPKGVLLPQSALTAQSQSLVSAWNYTTRDRLLHLLPLHHIHGTVNAILAPLHAGSSIEFVYPFNPTMVWNRLAAPFLPQAPEKSNEKKEKEKITFLTAVPTIYHRLLTTHPTLRPEAQSAARQAISPTNLRLNISGSAALPTPTKSAWAALSHGNVLLERYGMTEVGMALSCGLSFADRVDGSVGWPLPGVECRLFDLDTNEVILQGEEIDPVTGRERVGEIQLRGATVFQEYWRNPDATRSEFIASDTEEGSARKWFKTGDVAVRRAVEGAGTSVEKGQEWCRGPMYFIQGRKSVDIIKTGGEKVSALEVERELLSLPQISEAAVLALPSEHWGQKVAAVVVLNDFPSSSAAAPQTSTTTPPGKQKKEKWGIMDMRRALKDRLAAYKIPVEMRVLEDGLPRNAMGKVNKKMLVKEVFGDML
ncbi:hypothetical protein AJ80_00301 [Polytolypa hystricis UAMH7299]|uniref:AMP-dependent synthetase/ligase domain-containing protein n=1 Tax=Polytolypa hystricis (strain UAMH7299) TaxID=1447883 RepID=A0A2B7Z294_POLH7|nr:hypothetical protein AJ80_00301 [Polytolypa hystricis UAMH7299]